MRMDGDMNNKALRVVCLVGVALIVAFGTLWPRQVIHRKIELPNEMGWAVTDPDSLYHLRRIQLWSEGGELGDGYDEWLNHPHGAKVPWPPYYTVIARLMIGPGAPDDPDQFRRWIEYRAAHVPLVFGLGTALLAALAAWWLLIGLARRGGDEQRVTNIPIVPLAGAITAGLTYAFTGGSIIYSAVGNADHHAFVSFANAVVLVVFLHVARRNFPKPTSWRWGAFAGLLAGLSMGAWVGSLMYVICAQLILAAWMFRHSRSPLAGLPGFGLAFHLAAAFLLLPAVWSSPWLEEHPWMIVNLSWFHLLFLILGAAVFVPLIRLSPDPKREIYRRYPFLIGAVLITIFALVTLIPNTIGDGIRQGFDWLSTTDEFMASVAESRPLLGEGAEAGALVDYLGYELHLFPVAWLAIAAMWWRRRHTFAAILLEPWLIVLPILVVQAANQRRFADALAMPLAVVLVVAIARILQAATARWSNAETATAKRVLVQSIVAALVLVGPLASQWTIISFAFEQSGNPAPGAKAVAKTASPQMINRWLRQQPSNGDDGVLCSWGLGHAVTWEVQKPSVACNFGSYVGVDSFKTPSRFFLSDSAAEAEQILRDRKVRWVIAPWQLPGMLDFQVENLGERPFSDYFTKERGFTRTWFQTTAAHLMFDGGNPHQPNAQSLDYVRLVHISPARMQTSNLGGSYRKVPAGWVWQRVEGAVFEVTGEPGQELEVSLQVRYPTRKQLLQWTRRAVADENGVATLRVPYATDQPNGDGEVVGGLAWKMGVHRGEIQVPETAVWQGDRISISAN